MQRTRPFLPICAALLCVVLSGCKSTETPRSAAPVPPPAAMDAATQPDIAGSYALVSINGTPLPFTVTHEGPGIQVTSGTFTIRPDGTCTSVVAFVMPSGQSQSREVGATYTREGSTLRMQWQGAGVTEGTVEGDTFTMDNEGQVFRYQKAR